MTIPLDLNLKMAENGRPKPYEQGISSLTRVKRTYNELHNEASPPPNTPFKKHKTYSRFHGSPEYHSPNVRILESSPLTPQNIKNVESKDYFETQYQILKKLGSGSFSDVFKVMHRKDSKLYAVKRLKNQYTGVKDRQKKVNEVQKLKLLGYHPFCVQLHEAWEQNGFLHIRTELCEKGSLRQLIEEKDAHGEHFSEETIWNYIVDITLGLIHIHDQKVTHLDIKPGNILISNEGFLKIGDFGLAFNSPTEMGDDSEGDNVYLAPEVLEGIGSPSSDIFSFGVVILELCTEMQLPSEGEDWLKLRQADLSWIAWNDNISNDLKSLIKVMLCPDPKHRPTAEEIIQHVKCQEILRAREPSKLANLFYDFPKKIWTSLLGVMSWITNPPPPPPQIDNMTPYDNNNYSNLNQVPNINNNHSNSSNNNNNELLASPKPQDIVNPVFFGSYDEDSLDSDSSAELLVGTIGEDTTEPETSTIRKNLFSEYGD